MRNPFLKYILQRIAQCLLVIFVGITVTFVIPRLAPTDPVEIAMSRAAMVGQFTHPEAVDEMRKALKRLYGLEGSVFQQYVGFWRSLLAGDLGPSLSSFPTPVTSLIKISLPWTAGLLLISALLSWVIGNLLGGLAGYFGQRTWVRAFEILAMTFRPIPYYIMALLLIVLFAYIFPLFPVGGAFDIGIKVSFSWSFILSILRHAFLPALSLVIIGVGGWFLSMRTLVSNIVTEDYVVYAETAGISTRDILFKYIMRNALLPQITGLALQLGMIFNGALITEFVFNYPGLGYLSYSAISSGDYSLIMGITLFSIIGVAMGVLIIDLAYPLFDPRIRYS